MRDRKVIVCGGRTLKVTDGRIRGIIDLLRRINPTEEVSGGAPGGDQIGEIAARRLDIPVTCFKPKWEKYNPSIAPLRRNQEMADYVGRDGFCVVLPGGRGTADMETRAREKGMRIVKVAWEDEGYGVTLE